jgi:hypothetical protein
MQTLSNLITSAWARSHGFRCTMTWYLSALNMHQTPRDLLFVALCSPYSTLGSSLASSRASNKGTDCEVLRCRGNAVPVTDAVQRVPPALQPDAFVEIDHAQIYNVDNMHQRNKRLVVHHYVTRSAADYQTKLARGAGDHKHNDTLRGMGFFDAVKECVLVTLLLPCILLWPFPPLHGESIFLNWNGCLHRLS